MLKWIMFPLALVLAACTTAKQVPGGDSTVVKVDTVASFILTDTAGRQFASFNGNDTLDIGDTVQVCARAYNRRGGMILDSCHPPVGATLPSFATLMHAKDALAEGRIVAINWYRPSD
jgi:hypothetical protein